MGRVGPRHEQRVDHFDPENTATFKQRLCLYTKWWKTAGDGGFKAAAAAPGPILYVILPTSTPLPVVYFLPPSRLVLAR